MAKGFQMLETWAVALVGGLLFAWLHLPLAWMLGPLAAVLLWGLLVKRKLCWSIKLRNTGLVVLGYTLGLSFSIESAKQISSQFPYMFIATVLTTGFSFVLAYVIARRTGITFQTSAVGNIPGGLSQMVVLSEEIVGSDPGVVTFLQTIRLLTVIFTVPFIAIHGFTYPEGVQQAQHAAATEPGLLAWAAVLPLVAKIGLAILAAGLAGWGASRLKLPTPWFLGPILVGALLMMYGAEPYMTPTPLINLAQLAMGVHLGLSIKLEALSGWRKLLPYALGSSILLVVFCMGIAYMFRFFHPVSLSTGFLSVSPGGMTEMGVTARAVGGDVSTVVAYQMFRILFILFIVPYVLRWMFRSKKTAPLELGQEGRQQAG